MPRGVYPRKKPLQRRTVKEVKEEEELFQDTSSITKDLKKNTSKSSSSLNVEGWKEEDLDDIISLDNYEPEEVVQEAPKVPRATSVKDTTHLSRLDARDTTESEVPDLSKQELKILLQKHPKQAEVVLSQKRTKLTARVDSMDDEEVQMTIENLKAQLSANLDEGLISNIVSIQGKITDSLLGTEIEKDLVADKSFLDASRNFYGQYLIYLGDKIKYGVLYSGHIFQGLRQKWKKQEEESLPHHLSRLNETENERENKENLPYPQPHLQ